MPLLGGYVYIYIYIYTHTNICVYIYIIYIYIERERYIHTHTHPHMGGGGGSRPLLLFCYMLGLVVYMFIVFMCFHLFVVYCLYVRRCPHCFVHVILCCVSRLLLSFRLKRAARGRGFKRDLGHSQPTVHGSVPFWLHSINFVKCFKRGWK